MIGLRGVIRALADEPWPAGARKLSGTEDIWRVRVRVDGQPWRVVCQVTQAEAIVVVVRVVRRDDATYRRVP